MERAYVYACNESLSDLIMECWRKHAVCACYELLFTTIAVAVHGDYHYEGCITVPLWSHGECITRRKMLGYIVVCFKNDKRLQISGVWRKILTAKRQKCEAFLLCGLLGAQASDVDFKERAVAEANNYFSHHFYQVLKWKPGNCVFSPFSAMAVLGMAYIGSAGETATQMAKSLRLPGQKDATKAGFKSVLTRLKKLNGDVTLLMANKLYVDVTASVKKSFKESIRKYFLSEVQQMDFLRKKEESVLAINKWVEDKTSHNIKDIISQDAIDPMGLMLLVNAMYFKGKWSHNFSPADTHSDTFHSYNNKSVDIDMMFTRGLFNFAEFDSYRVLKMYYKNRNISMVVLLPNEISGITGLEEILPSLDWTSIDKKSALPSTVELSLPKFKMETQVKMKDILIELGMTHMFTRIANFSGISKHDIFVGNVVQKTFLDVTEEGTEAASSTGLKMIGRRRFSQEPVQIFRADHPFIFLIRDEITGTILFCGRYSDPRVSIDD
ncbi:serpin B6 [Anabrus simplex]|uniref:serpin B6 n=1 Tax=Anabrus simplex TaxID=316456 RepID=UPI0035A29DE8